MPRSTTPQPEFGIAASWAQSTWRRIKGFPLHQAVGPNGLQQESTNSTCRRMTASAPK